MQILLAVYFLWGGRHYSNIVNGQDHALVAICNQ